MMLGKSLFGIYVIPFVLLVALTGLGVGYVAYNQVSDLSKEVTLKEFQKNNETVTSQLQIFLEAPKHVAEIQAQHLQSYSSPEEILQSATPKVMFSDLLRHQHVVSMQYADENNFSFALSKNVFNVPYSYAEIGIHPKMSTNAAVYSVDGAFNIDRTKPIVESSAYDVRVRPWYQTGIKSAVPLWTDVYAWIPETGEVGVDYVYPIGTAGKNYAVLTASLTLNSIKTFLNELLYVSPLSQIYILDADGDVVTGTDIVSVPTPNGEEFKQVHASESQSKYLKQVYADVKARGGLLDSLKTSYRETDIDGETYYYSITRYAEDSTLEWYVVSLLRANVVISKIQSTNQTMVFLSLGIILIAVVLAFLISQSIIRPVTHLNSAVRAFEREGVLALDEKVVDGPSEINLLANSFVTMADKIRGQIKTLEKQEDILTIENEKLSKTIESIGEAVIVLDKDLNVILMNKVAEKMTGNPMAFSKGKHFDDVCILEKPLSHSTRMPAFISRALETGAIQIEDDVYNVVSKRGAKIPAICLASPIFQEEGEVHGVVVVIRDITEEQQINRTKGDIVSIASHQLRTPLSIVKWNSELLLSNRTGDRITQRERTYIEEIANAISQMIELVDNLLRASQFELGVFRIKREELNVKEVIIQVVEFCKERCTRGNITMSLKIAKNAQKYTGDRELFAMIVQNLITNASKYSKDGGKVTISASMTDKHFVFEVKDEGIGIPEEEKKKLFTKLYRGTEARKVNPNGSGLGLYIVKLITEKVHGYIKVQSEVGVGSTFTVLLPKRGMK